MEVTGGGMDASPSSRLSLKWDSVAAAVTVKRYGATEADTGTGNGLTMTYWKHSHNKSPSGYLWTLLLMPKKNDRLAQTQGKSRYWRKKQRLGINYFIAYR